MNRVFLVSGAVIFMMHAGGAQAELARSDDPELKRFMGGPVRGTMANDKLQRDIAASLYMTEHTRCHGKPGTIVGARPIADDGTNIIERWTVNSCGRSAVYDIKMVADANRGTYFLVHPLDNGQRAEARQVSPSLPSTTTSAATHSSAPSSSTRPPQSTHPFQWLTGTDSKE